jgi:hypothetical protein
MVRACLIKLLGIVKQKSIFSDFPNPCFDNLGGQSDLNSPQLRVVPGFVAMYYMTFRYGKVPKPHCSIKELCVCWLDVWCR